MENFIRISAYSKALSMVRLRAGYPQTNLLSSMRQSSRNHLICAMHVALINFIKNKWNIAIAKIATLMIMPNDQPARCVGKRKTFKIPCLIHLISMCTLRNSRVQIFILFKNIPYRQWTVQQSPAKEKKRQISIVESHRLIGVIRLIWTLKISLIGY